MNLESAELINVTALAKALLSHLQSALREAIPAKRLVNVDEAAEHCGLTRDSFSKKVVRDRLRKVRLDKCWRFDKADPDVWIDEHKSRLLANQEIEKSPKSQTLCAEKIRETS